MYYDPPHPNPSFPTIHLYPHSHLGEITLTTSQTLAHIRMSIRLIEQSFSLTHMDFRYGYALGQASFAVMQGIIGHNDYKELQEEAKVVADTFKNKFNKSLDSNLSVA